MQLEPLTDRILAALPGPRRLWVVVWASLPALNAAINALMPPTSRSPIWKQSDVLVAVNYVALTVGIVVALWGTRRIARRLEALLPPPNAFRELNDVRAPLVLSVGAAVVFGLSTASSDGWSQGALRGATWLLVGVPLWSFLWAYVSLQLGLGRLGRERLLPDDVNVDPGLGLRPLGAVAFMGLWMLLVWLVPLVLTGLPDVAGSIIGILVLAAALAAFFLSLYRLHRQMVDVKQKELGIARDLYAQAYAPVRAAPTLDALEEQRALLAAADALERRAQAIHDWPIDEGTLARVLTIATSVVAMTVARLILDPLGL